MDAEAVRTLTGLTADTLAEAELSACVRAAETACSAYMRSKGASPSGSAYDTGVLYYAIILIRQNLDLKGVKPTSISIPGIAMTTDAVGMTAQLKAMADRALADEVAAQLGGRRYLRHIRSGMIR